MHTTLVHSTARLPDATSDLSEKLIAQLSNIPATLTAVVLAHKQAPWNVRGPGFAAPHELLAVETRTYTDLVAGRATSLGRAATETPQAAAELTTLAHLARHGINGVAEYSAARHHWCYGSAYLHRLRWQPVRTRR